MSKKALTVHPKIKALLGYNEDTADSDFLADWKKRSTQVCKPCWELKYCPYGPLVEQLPLLPTIRNEAERHHEHLKQCLATGVVGTPRPLPDEIREAYTDLIEAAEDEPRVIAPLAARSLYLRDLYNQGAEDGADISEALAPPLSDFEKYQVPFPLDEGEGEFPDVPLEPELKEAIIREIEKMKAAIDSGIDDRSQPIGDARRKMFQADVDGFNPEDFPETIPEEVECMACRHFGHICPVVFVGESITETTEARRKGRHIPTPTMMHIVRRDNHTCQECSKHLLDEELEFDHIIPISKGGSSEEHNIRLTCFKCNRSKSDKVDI